MEVEAKRRPAADYIETVQVDVTANMRAILVDWLVEVAEEYKLVFDKLYLTVSYIDRFLSANAISRQKLQLLATSSDYWSLVSNQYPSGKFPKVSIGITIPRVGSLSRGRDAATTPPLLTAFIPNWWIWGYWISPLMYGYNGLAVNELYAPRWMNKFVMDNNGVPKRLGIAMLQGANSSVYGLCLCMD